MTRYDSNDSASYTNVTVKDKGGSMPPAAKKRKVWGYWVVIVLLLAACGTLGYLWVDASDTRDRLRYRVLDYERKSDQANEQIASLKADIDTLKLEKKSAYEALDMLKSTVKGTMPMVITDIEMANTTLQGDIETDYGNTIYASNTMYLKPKLKYYGLDSGRKTLMVKFFRPNGSLATGVNSPAGYSYKSDYSIETGPGRELVISGWGGSKKGHWESGTYRIEIYYNGTCLKTYRFEVK